VSRWSTRLASRILLALALIVLQQGALTHALSHQLEPAKPHGTKQCELCHAFAAADAEITPPAAAPPAPPKAAASPQRCAKPTCHVRRIAAFASRAPPALS
jgi:nitrate/TMAO reductase-like tetraheme cytochrome c subunit